MSFNILTDQTLSIITAADEWQSKYRDAFLNTSHDRSQLTLVHPDDCLVMFGPPRLADARVAEMMPLGFLQSLQFTETRSVQPMKSIGSRRHIFAATNAPVQGSIGRLLCLNPNLARLAYAPQDTNGVFNEGDPYVNAGNITDGVAGDTSGLSTRAWYTDLEEDLFRIPFGLGIVYNSPISASAGSSTTAEYIESCVFTSKNIALQSGQAMVMEQISFYADRVVGWADWYGAN